ncbi:hypothetical protein PybrP1_009009 [[Pythium] brassicae (nom. inval.)]|nr:hypothetical protein PybrP1_009009 [[Pythium] brassicae (nom. inval.)]
MSLLLAQACVLCDRGGEEGGGAPASSGGADSRPLTPCRARARAAPCARTCRSPSGESTRRAGPRPLPRRSRRRAAAGAAARGSASRPRSSRTGWSEQAAEGGQHSSSIGGTVLVQQSQTKAPAPHTAQRTRGDVVDRDVEEREQPGERVHRAAVLEVADHRDDLAREPVEVAAQLVVDRVEVQQRLRRVLADAVAGVQHGLARGGGGDGGAALHRVAQHDHVRVALEAADRVAERLALLAARRALVHRHDEPAEAQHRGLERARRARRRLKEHVREQLPRRPESVRDG